MTSDNWDILVRKMVDGEIKWVLTREKWGFW
jgi:hypothetical protein